MLSCGIDSLAMFALNRKTYAEDHPRRLTAGIVVNGFDCANLEQYTRVLNAARRIGGDAGIDIIPVSTNMQELVHWKHPTRPLSVLWSTEWHGSALASIGHALSANFSSVSIAGTFDIPNMRPWGSHPLTDPLYGLSDVQVFHENVTLSRFEKTRVVVEWDAALANLLVCADCIAPRRTAVVARSAFARCWRLQLSENWTIAVPGP